MSNALTTGGALSTEDYYAALAAEASTYSGGGSGSSFLKFDGNDGTYSFGAENTELAIDTQAVMDVESYKRGYVCWKGGNVVDEIMLSLIEGAPPPVGNLPDHGPYGKDDGWNDQKTVSFYPIDGEFEGQNLLFQANNKSKNRALEGVMKDFGRQFRANPGMVPVVQLGTTQFEITPEEGGRKIRKHAPLFKIVGWMSREEYNEMVGEAQAAYAERQSLDNPGGAAAIEGPAAEPVAEEPAPVVTRGGRRPAPVNEPAGRAANTVAAEPAAEAPAATEGAAPARRRRF